MFTAKPFRRTSRTLLRLCQVFVVAVALFAALPDAARAANFTWDANGIFGDGNQDGGGTWSTGATNWNNGGADIGWPNSGTNDDVAILGVGSGAAGTVTVSGTVNANGITFNAPGSGNYTINGTTLTLNGVSPTITVAAGQSPTISAPIAGGAGLLKTGTGTLTLNNTTNSYTGGTVISQGTIQSQGNGSTQGLVTLGDASTGANNVAWLFNGGGTPTNNITVFASPLGTVTIGTFSAGAFTTHSGTITLNRTTTFSDGTGDRTSFLGQITGNVSQLTLTGTRITLDNSSNNFLGGVTVNAGTILQTNANEVIPNTTSVIVNGNLYFNSTTETIDVLSGSGNVQVHPAVNQITTLTVGSSNGSGAFAGTIQNGGAGASTVSLKKTGTGAQDLNGANSYTGGTTISQGILGVGNATGLGTNTVTLNDASTGANNTSLLAIGAFTVGNNIVVANQGAGTSTIGTGIVASGLPTVFTGSVTLNKATTFQGGNTDRTTYQGIISGSGPITITSAAVGGRRTTWENNSNSFTGNISIASFGTILQIGSGGASSTVIPDTVSVDVGAGSFFYFNTGAEAIDGLTGSGTVQKHPAVGGTMNFTIGANNANATFNGSIINGSGVLSLTKAGTGTQTLNGASSYSGGTTVRQGTLLVGNGSALGTNTATLNDASTGANNTSLLATGAFTVANNIVVANQGTGTPTIGTSDFNPGPAATFFTGNVALNKATTFQGGNTDRTTYQGIISGGGPITITSAGVGGRRTTWENNSNSFTGNISITGAGTILQIGSGGASSTVIPDTVSVDVGAGSFFYFNTGAEAIDGLTGSGTVQKHPGVGGTMNFTIGANNANATFSGSIINGSGVLSLTKTGGGTQTLTGNSSYTGITRLNGGVVSVPSLNDGTLNSPIGAANGFNSNILFAGGTLQYTGGNFTWVREVTLNAGGGTFDISTAGTTLTIDSNFVSAGNDIMVGVGGLTKTGPGTLRLNDANTYSGGTVVSQGTLLVGNATALGTNTATLNDANTGINNTSLLATGAFTVANNIVVANQGTGTPTIGTTSFISGSATLFTGTINLNKPTTMTGGNTDRTTYTNVISGSVGTLTVTGGARTTWENTNTFVGDVAITGAGTILQVGDGALINSNQIPDASNVNVGAGTFLHLVFDDEAINALNGSGTVRPFSGLGNRTLTVGAANGSGLFSGVMADQGGSLLSLVKAGTGTETLTGGNTYTGTTTVSKGILQIDNGGTTGSLNGASAITIGDAATGAGDASFLVNRSDVATVANPITVSALGTGVARIGANSTVGANRTDFTNTITLNRTTTFLGESDRTTIVGTITGSGPIIIDSFDPVSATNIAGSRVTFDNNGNSFTGGVTVNALAILQINNTNVIPDTNNVAVNGQLYFNSSGETINGLNGSGNIQVHPGVVTPATLTVGGNNGGGNFSGTIVNGGAAMSLTKTGTGTQELSGGSPNTYTGVTNVNDGVLKISKNSALGATSGNTVVASGASLEIAGGLTYAATEPLSLNGAGFGAPGNTGALFMNDGGSSTFAGPITIAAPGATIGAFNSGSGNSTLTLTGNVNKNGTTVTFLGNGNANIINLNGGVSGAAANSDLIVDNVTVNLNSAANYNGPTLVRNTGIFNVTAAGSAITTNITVGSAATGTVNQNGNVTVNGTGGISPNPVTPANFLPANNVMPAGTGHLIINNGSAYNLQSGVLDFRDYATGAPTNHKPVDAERSMIQVNTGGAFNFTGGTLRDVSVIGLPAAGGGTLTQNGASTRFVVGQDMIGPGATTTINGDYNLVSGVLAFDIFGAPVAPEDAYSILDPNDRLDVNGKVTLSGTLEINYPSFTPLFHQDWNVITSTSPIMIMPGFGVSGAFYRIVPIGGGGNGQALQVYVPEPGTIALWSLVGLLAGGYALRRRIRRA